MNEQIPTPPISDRRGSKVSLLDPLKRIGSPGWFFLFFEKRNINE